MPAQAYLILTLPNSHAIRTDWFIEYLIIVPSCFGDLLFAAAIWHLLTHHRQRRPQAGMPAVQRDTYLCQVFLLLTSSPSFAFGGEEADATRLRRNDTLKGKGP